MLHNYFKIIRRNLVRQPIHSGLNLLCLSIGIAAALLILMYINFEINYDRFHEKADRVFLLETESIKTHNKVIDVGWENASAPMAIYMKKDYPEVEATARFFNFFQNEKVELTLNDNPLSVEDVVAADSTVLDIFTFDFVYGSPEEALDGPNKIVLTESVAKRIFGEANPVGQILKTKLIHNQPDIDPNYNLMVTGVYRDLPKNSHLTLNGMISAASDPILDDYYFNLVNFRTYALLNPRTDADALAEKLTDIYTTYLDPKLEPVLKEAYHNLTPLTKIHMGETGGYAYLYIFGAIGLLMLLIAVISYVNLVTAQASKRSLEIGVRKVMGSTRRQLIGQFLSESLFFSVIAMGMAIALVVFAIPPINGMLGLQLDAQQLWQPQVVIGLLGILILIGILGGSYPAFFLSAFKPISVLKGTLSKGTPVRRVLVATQFAVVIFVLVSTGMIYSQLQFMRQKDLGFNKDQVVHVALTAEGALDKLPLLKTTLEQSPQIASVGTASFVPGLGMSRRPISADNGTSQESQFVDFGSIDYDYLETMDIELVGGRNFSKDHPNDATEHIIINERLAKNFGLEDPVGEQIRFGDSGNPNFVTVVGVVEDFHQSTLHDDIESQMFLLSPASFNLAVKINSDITTSINYIEKSWREVFPNETFAYRFLDEDLAQAYETDQVRAKLFLLFSIITIIISFLGLFGLVAYIAAQRVKEIGIRRVLGASTWNVVFLISKDFLLLVSLAAIPAFLVAWYFIQNWLEDFAFRADMNYALFGIVLLFILFLTFITTSLHAYRSTRLNPAETLKYE